MGTKPKLSVYWAASCGGCEIAITNLHERLLELDAAFDFVFCPCLLDTKKSDVTAMPDGSIAVTLFNGAIRTEENAEMARLLRRKSQLLIAFGACAYQGGIPALANLSSRRDLLKTVYQQGPGLDNPTGALPRTEVEVPEGTLELPVIHDRVRTLAEVVPVDYSVPGCPPEPHQIWAVVDAVIRGVPLPEPGSVLGAGNSTVCDECPRTRNDKVITKLYRTWEKIPDPELCLLEQGLPCVGLATRSGCGGLCPQVQMPCIGCYGPPEGVTDQGGKLAAALGSMIDIEPLKGLPEEQIFARIDEFLDQASDWAGTFYKFSLAGSSLRAAMAARAGTEIERGN
jgi:F420-non-reducing hydrogenase small subunit